jgi:membrane protein
MTDAKPFNFGRMKHLLAEAWAEWNNDNAPRLGAALAFYTMLSLAPLLVVIIGIAGLVFGQEAAQGQIFGQIRGMVGDQGAAAIQEMIKHASNMGSGIMATIVGVLMLLFAATGVVTELRSSLNAVWGIPPKTDSGVVGTVKERGYAVAVVLACGFLLVVTLVVSAALAAMGHFFGQMLPIPEAVMQAINFVISLAVITGVFALIFKYLPDVQLAWNDVLLGAAVTAVMFTIGKFLIGMYLGKASIGSAYGAAGSLAIVLVWVYYSAQIFFFGAEFTEVYAREHGSDPAGSRKKAAEECAVPQNTPQARQNAAPEPDAVHAYARTTAEGNAGLPPSAVKAKSALLSAGMLLGVFAAAGREISEMMRKKNRA